VKTLALIARKPGLTREEFRRHYETKHAPLALPLMSGLLRYVRHHVVEEISGVAGFDVMTSFTYRDAAALEGVLARLATRAGEAVRRDEVAFMDKPRNRFFAVRDVAETGNREGSSALQCLALVTRAAEQSPTAFAAEFASHALPEFHDAVRGLRWSLHHESLPSFGEPPCDAVVLLHADRGEALAAWCASREREGTRVTLVRVREHETELPPGGVR